MKTDPDMPELQSAKEPSKMAGSAPVWIGVAVVFSLLAMAWTALFFYASKHRAMDVPLEHRKTEGAR